MKHSSRNPIRMNRTDLIVGAIVLFAILLGGFFRFTGNNWDDFVRWHPDERYLTGEIGPAIGGSLAAPVRVCEGDASGCTLDEKALYDRYQVCLERFPQSNGRGGYFDTDCSPYNPENVRPTHYSYGTLPLFIAHLSAEFWSNFTGDPIYTQYAGFQLIWRVVSAAMDTLAIVFVFLIGKQLYDKWVGALAAVLYAAAVLPIQVAHFGTADATASLFVTVTIYFAVRAQDRGSLWDYAFAGLALGAAVSSRINVAYLAGVIPLVAAIRILPTFDSGMSSDEKFRIVLWNVIGVVVAAFVSMVAFRLFNPYAFKASGIIPTGIDHRFLDTLAISQRNVSGEAESPPNWQWVNRTPYLFAFQNMVLWGMGLALGLVGWFAWLKSGWNLVFARSNGIRNIVPFAWIGVYFAATGGLWVMSMRYYLPLYAALCVLAAWLLLRLWQQAQQNTGSVRRVLAAVILFGVTGFTLLWAVMFTNIYRHQATFVQGSYWVEEYVPGDFYTRLDGASSEDPLININFWNTLRSVDNIPTEDQLLEMATNLVPDKPASGQFVAPADGTISSITAFRLVGVTQEPDPLTGLSRVVHDFGERTLRISITQLGEETPLAVASMSGVFPPGGHVLGKSYTFELDSPVRVEAGQTYYLNAVAEGGGMLVSGAVMSTELPWDEPFPATVCTLPYDVTLADDPPSGLLSARDCNGSASWQNQIHAISMDVVMEDIPEKRDRWKVILDQLDYIAIQTNRRYDSQSRIPARWPMTNIYYDALFSGDLGFDLEAVFQETFEFGPLRVSDQVLPTDDLPDWMNEFEAEEAFHVYDHPVVFIFKKSDDYSSEKMRTILDSAELTRSGSVFGAYNNPEIAELMPLASLEADKAPTQLQLTDDMKEVQQSGGTWSERFDRDSFLNRNQIILVIVWWLTIELFGFAIWPLLFHAFPALADRGYGLAKFAGILLTAWIAWVLATLRLPAWSGTGIGLILAGLLILSAIVAWRSRDTLLAFCRERWKLLVVMEALGLGLFLLLIGIRLLNPDLWHQAYGGEKPMDFAYFNAVLRSTIFPAYDPWFAGGYINYYYFGFVIVGTPTLLLGVIPSIAYNLILPTIFSVVGVSAFSLAFSIVNGWWIRRETRLTTGERIETRRRLGNPWVAGVLALTLAVLMGNLGIPGVFVGHVATLGGYERPSGYYNYFLEQEIDKYVRQNATLPDDAARVDLEIRAQERAADVGIFGKARYQAGNIAALGKGFIRGLDDALIGDGVGIPASRWFWSPTRIIAEIPNQQDGAINEMPFFTFLYGDLHAHMIAMPMMLFAMAFVYNELMTAGRDRRSRWGQALALFFGGLVIGLFQATNTWDLPTFVALALAGLVYVWWLKWHPIARTQSDVMIFFMSFTLVEWGALIALLVVLAALLVYAGILIFAAAAVALVGFIVVGWSRLSRRSLLDFVARIGGFGIVVFVAALPFSYWFASDLTEFKIWDGKKTPLWAFLTIHGLFLFLIASLLLWETVRWLRNAHVSQLRWQFGWFVISIVGIVIAPVVALVLAWIGYQAALVVVPMIVWSVVLFFRPGQSRPMQFTLALSVLALCIVFGTEFVTLATDNGRQNTIFKFYIQAWLMFSVAGGVAFAWVVADSFEWRTRFALPWYMIAGLLLMIAGLYPILATRAKSEYRMVTQGDVPLTLDGDAYMDYAQHWEGGIPGGTWMELKHDANVIRWLEDNVQGSPVILEGMGQVPLYTWTSRISINTGLPTVIGWDYHQRQQRSLSMMGEIVNMRVANVNALYSTTDVDEAVRILDYFGVEYVILSAYERYRYATYDLVTGELIDDSSLKKFDEMVEMGLLELVYQEDMAAIYHVNQDQLFDYRVDRVAIEERADIERAVGMAG